MTRLLSAIPLVLLVVSAAEAREIGVATAVVPQTSGTLPSGAAQALETGSKVHASERITCGPQGRAQLVFEDGTSLNVGAGSDLVLDRYVYDPDKGTGEMATSMSKGVLRFVGGRISKKKKVTVKTPVGTVGIRGGIALIAYEPGGALEAKFLFGDAMTVTAGGATRVVERAGLSIRVPPQGRPSAPRPITAEGLGDTLGGLEPAAVQGMVADATAGVDAAMVQVAEFERAAAMVAPIVDGLPGEIARAAEPAAGVANTLAEVLPAALEQINAIEIPDEIQRILDDPSAVIPDPDELPNADDFDVPGVP